MSQQTEQVELAAEKRSVLGKQVSRLRRQGWVPGVMYGRGFDPVSLQFKERSLRQLLSHVGGSQLVGVKVEGAKKPQMAIVRDVQRDPTKGTLIHVDFYRVEMTERLTTEVPLVMIGESPVAQRGEGILMHGLSVIEVECLPGDLVDGLEVDLSDLIEVDQGIYVRDLAIPSGIDILTDPDEMIARVVPLKEEEIIEEVEEEEVLVPEGEEVEVITEAREGEEEAAEGEEE